MLFVVKWVLMVGFVVAFEGVCVETQWVFGVLVGLFAFSDLSILAFCVYVRMGMRGQKCKIPLILPFLGLYLSFHL